MTMTPEQARSVRRDPIEPGKYYAFYSEMQQAEDPPEKRMRRFTGQAVLAVRNLRGRNDPDPEYDGPGPNDVVDPDTEDGNSPGYFECSRAFIVRAQDGTEFTAMEEELNGWDRDLDQFFWPDGTYGNDHETWALVNERDEPDERAAMQALKGKL